MKSSKRLSMKQHPYPQHYYPTTPRMKRRSFIQAVTGVAALGVSAQMLGGMPLLAMSPDKFGADVQNTNNILIVIQLFGGNDGLNTVIPVDDPNYYRMRPTLGIRKEQATRLFGSRVYLHPALTNGVPYGGFKQLYEDGRLAIVQGVGYENPNLSHFRSTDIWLSGINTSLPTAELTDGWIGRAMARMYAPSMSNIPDYPLCVQIGGTLSMLLKDERRGDMGIALADPEQFFQLGRGLTPDDIPPADGSVFAQEYAYIRMIAQKSDTYSQLLKQAFERGRNTVEYASGFPQQLRAVARLISGGLQSKVYLVYLNGFDTHVLQQQPDGSGIHPRLLNTLATGIMQFMQDALQQRFADRVIGMTISEFGRRPQENGSLGTDHGAASVQFVFGNSVNANVFGNPFDLVNLNNNGDLQYQYDYRRVYANVLQAWFGASEQETRAILGERIAPLGVIQARATHVYDAFVRQAHGQPVSITPNPSRGTSVVQFELRSSAHVDVALFSTEGRLYQQVWNAVLPAGVHALPCNIAHTGSYICVVRTGGSTISLPLMVIR
ncbi:MAG: DUF1501 domain-containing protein [Bacteroidota bacterium]|nr:DUF1501 domain-containing protein [Candidatus Kapabacteria bacterium]MDW8219626.1 DUF1501 domain-containing protein [Bacteroidota bacterium]